MGKRREKRKVRRPNNGQKGRKRSKKITLQKSIKLQSISQMKIKKHDRLKQTNRLHVDQFEKKTCQVGIRKDDGK